MAVLAAGAVLASSVAQAESPSFFRIVSGSAGGTYFPMAGIIATAISKPPGSRPCDEGGSCGVPGLIAVAQSSDGSVENANAIQSGAAESGLVQSDVAWWAYNGSGLFEDEEPATNLRVLASLFPEHVHAVLPRQSPVTSLTDLEGRTVGIGLPESGAQVGALLILNAAGLERGVDYSVEELNMAQSAERVADGRLDGFLTVAGVPSGGISQLAATAGMRLLPIEDGIMDAVIEEAPFYYERAIPANSYEGQGEAVPTLAIAALWLVNADVSEDLVYGITEALFNDTSRELLRKGHPRGADVNLGSALDGAGIPLHPGAERYYREVGKIR